jgi:hypothetical protein
MTSRQPAVEMESSLFQHPGRSATSLEKDFREIHTMADIDNREGPPDNNDPNYAGVEPPPWKRNLLTIW